MSVANAETCLWPMPMVANGLGEPLCVWSHCQGPASHFYMISLTLRASRGPHAPYEARHLWRRWQAHAKATIASCAYLTVCFTDTVLEHASPHPHAATLKNGVQVERVCPQCACTIACPCPCHCMSVSSLCPCNVARHGARVSDTAVQGSEATLDSYTCCLT